MKKILTAIFALFSTGALSSELKAVDIDHVSNAKIKDYEFLQEMYEDNYFPNVLVDKGKNILIELCLKIETEKPKDDAAVYALTHRATEKFNSLAIEFEENDSDIETAARDAIGRDFDYILSAYGYELDIEEAIAPRDW